MERGPREDHEPEIVRETDAARQDLPTDGTEAVKREVALPEDELTRDTSPHHPRQRQVGEDVPDGIERVDRRRREP